MLNVWDKQSQDVLRQARTPGQGFPTAAASGGSVAGASATTTTRVEDGEVKQLWLLGFSPFDEPGYYFGDEPLPEDFT